ncbi:glycogen synthase GlgA [candidate division KSB1 bacterium]|nr:glycogen synthase GlgA [candidate division KSB1 bacterium]
MKNRLRILFLSSEIAPFAKTGGLADVSSALPKAFHDMGHDVRIMMPKYGSINDRKYILREVIRLKKIKVKMGAVDHYACAKSAFIPDSKVQVYFLEYKPFFDRPELYVDPNTGTEFPDNAERFALFCKAALETIKLLHWEPQIIHCNDWQAALISWYLKYEYNKEPFFSNCSTVLSIHNMAYQGHFQYDNLKQLGIPENLKEGINDLKHGDGINFLKGGILTADKITTVSQAYANEVLNDSEIGAGMGDYLQQRKNDFEGILNGVDYSIWDPETDKLLEENYSLAKPEGKAANKKLLLEKCNFPPDESKPVIGIISRLAEQKGFDLIIDAIKDIVSLDARMVILGTGDPKYHESLEKLSKTYSKNIALFLRFDNELAHLIEAGSDIFLMPSRYEPCGLNQLYSLKYGTVPVVRKTGGLADTIVDYISDSENGNGFVFEDYNGKAMVTAIKHAVETFKDQKTWQKLMKRGMRADYSWQVAAEKYLKIFMFLVNSRKHK